MLSHVVAGREYLLYIGASVLDLGFKNMAVLVTGSTRGIGYAVAQDLLSRGATVGIHGRTMAGVETACRKLKGDNKVSLAGDLSDPDHAAELVRSFCDSTGRIDGLVNNAGGGKAAAFRGMDLVNWRNTFSINLEAAMIACREAYTIMRKQKSGAIVNVASISAHGPGKWMGADYAASKAGLVSLTKSLAFEAARFNIRVNAVSPGMVNTDMTSVLSDEMKEGLNIPMKRLAEPSEIASVVCFLLSAGSSYMTGQVLHVNGGLGM